VARRLKILVAEDDENDFLFLQCMLKNAGVAYLYQVKDGEDAMAYLAGKDPFSNRSTYPFPDILLLDLKLPKISGHEILESLSPAAELRPARIYVLSGSDLDEDRARAGRAGADDYFVKPLCLGHLAVLFKAD